MDRDLFLPAFLFDLDGVLIDSSDLHWQSWQELFAESGSPLFDYADYKKTFGMTNETILQNLAPHTSAAERSEIGLSKEKHLRRLAKGKIQLLPGMESFLKSLDERRHPAIIASSTPIANLQFYIEHTPLGRYLSSFVSGEEVKMGKPHPDIFIEAAARLNLKPQACIALEDSPAGLQAAKDAGCFVVALATSHLPAQLTNYHLLFASPLELDLDGLIKHWQKWATKLP